MIVSIRGRRYCVEVAVTPEEHARGLAGRPALPEECGMLFVFPVPEKVPIWNRGMRFPIDVLWIDGNHEIVQSAELPCESPDTTIEILSDSEVAYVLELPKGEILS